MHTKIIAKVAWGHEGKPEFCTLYVQAAAKAKADVVKFLVVYAGEISETGHEYYELYPALEPALSV